MGDRVSVTLTVRVECKAAVIDSFTSIGWEDGESYYSSDKLQSFVFNGVNQGELPFLETLQNKGIAYTSYWEAGSEYGSGKETCRFNQYGDMQLLQVYDADAGIPIAEVEGILDNHELLKEVIQNHIAKTVPWSWDNQIQYGKVYQARRLIADT